jgi:hypothetical protein
MKIQRDTIITLLVFLAVFAYTLNFLLAGVFAFGFARGLDKIAARKEKKAQQEAYEAEQKARKLEAESKETDAMGF